MAGSRNGAAAADLIAGIRITVAAIALLIGVLPVVAGRMPVPSDILPSLSPIEFREGDVIMGGRYILRGSEWDGWSAPPLQRGNDSRGRPVDARCASSDALFCEGDRDWFSSRAYCGEGSNDQGRLYSYDSNTRTQTNYEGAVPRCESIVAGARVGDQLWLASLYSGEYGDYPGSGVIIYDLKAGRLTSSNAPAKYFDSQHLVDIAYQKERRVVWVTSRTAIHRYSLDRKEWERRILDVTVGEEGRLDLILTESGSSSKGVGLAYHLLTFHIPDRLGFARTWEAIEITPSDPPFKHPMLFPHYVSAMASMDGQGSDFDFTYLLRHIASYRGSEARIRAAFDELEAGDLTPSRRALVQEERQQLGLTEESRQADAHFELLKIRYFGSGDGLDDLCDLAVGDSKYHRWLNAYFKEKPFMGEVDVKFVEECVRPNFGRDWKKSLLSLLHRGLEEDDPAMLRAACGVFRPGQLKGSRRSWMLGALLQARHLAQKYAGTAEDPGPICKTALEGAAHEMKGATRSLINHMKFHPEHTPLAEEVLREVTGQSLSGFQAWFKWWTLNRESIEARP